MRDAPILDGFHFIHRPTDDSSLDGCDLCLESAVVLTLVDCCEDQPLTERPFVRSSDEWHCPDCLKLHIEASEANDDKARLIAYRAAFEEAKRLEADPWWLAR